MLPLTYHILLFKSMNSASIVNHYRSTVYLPGYITPLEQFLSFYSVFKITQVTATYITFKFELFYNFFLVIHLNTDDKRHKVLATILD